MNAGGKSDPPAIPPARGAWGLLPALALVAVVLLVKLVYIIALCPYNLVEDEAHYWLWSRHLDWSYYSKGPGIAWAIWFSTTLFGDQEWAVRLPTVLAQAVGALACAGLVRDIVRSGAAPGEPDRNSARAAVFAAAAYLLAPAFQLTGILVTIDGCYLACWAVACWAAWRAIVERSRLAWLLLGAALGIGFLFKYTILLLIPGLALFATAVARRRGDRATTRPGQRWWILGGLAFLLLALAPVAAWNAREGWPTIRHLLGHLGAPGGDMPPKPAADRGFSLLPMLTYIVSPLGMFGPLLVLALHRLTRASRLPDRASTRPNAAMGRALLVWAFVPIFAFYLVVSLVAEPEQNWSIAGFITLMALAGWHAAEGPGIPPSRARRVLWRLGIIYGLSAAIVLHRGDLIAGAINGVVALPPARSAFTAVTGREPGRIVLGRLIGSEQMAAHAGRILGDLERSSAARGLGPPFVMCEHYGRASQMAYYLNRHAAGGQRAVSVLSTQGVMGGRKSQFDFWPDTDLSRPDLLGRDALLMSNDQPGKLEQWRAMFERVEPIAKPTGKLDGEHKKDRFAYIGRGYRGVPSRVAP